MANNCLVTKLKGVVDNDNLPRLGELKFEVAAPDKTVYVYLDSQNSGLSFRSDIPVTITNYGDNIVSGLENVYEGTLPAGIYHVKVTNQTGNVYVKGKYGLSRIGTGYRSINAEVNAIKFDVSQLEFSSIVAIQALMSDFYGTLNANNIQKLVNLTLTDNRNFVVDITNSNIANDEIEYLQIQNSLAYGNISALSACTSLKGLELSFTNCEGDLKTMVEGLVANGRTATDLRTYTINGKMTYDGVVLDQNVISTLNGGLSSTILTFEFSPSYPGGFRIKTA